MQPRNTIKYEDSVVVPPGKLMTIAEWNEGSIYMKSGGRVYKEAIIKITKVQDDIT